MTDPSRGTLLLLFLLLLPGTVAGQGAAHTLRKGDEVRVFAPSFRYARVRGTVVLYQGAALEIRERTTGSIVAIPITSIEGLARNEGTDRGRSSWRMARLGGFIGGAGGFVAGPLIATSRAPDRFGEVMLASGLIGTAAGAGLGAVLGAVFARDHWQRFRTPIVPTVAAGRGTVDIGVAARLP